MLHTATVEKGTFRLLRNLANNNKLLEFILVGGTALALYIGHRKSVDIDLFTKKPFNENDLEKHLIKNFGFETLTKFRNTLMGKIDNVKVDFIAHQYEDIGDILVTKEGIRITSMEDIAAMKLSAITGSGQRLKDFVDIAYFSMYFSLNEMLHYYSKKYNTTNTAIQLRALTYFDDIEHSAGVDKIGGNYSWKKIEKRIGEMVKNDKKIFRSPPLGNIRPGISL
jgi:predicted nucleotidyltransferase